MAFQSGSASPTARTVRPQTVVIQAPATKTIVQPSGLTLPVTTRVRTETAGSQYEAEVPSLSALGRRKSSFAVTGAGFQTPDSRYYASYGSQISFGIPGSAPSASTMTTIVAASPKSATSVTAAPAAPVAPATVSPTRMRWASEMVETPTVVSAAPHPPSSFAAATHLAPAAAPAVVTSPKSSVTSTAASGAPGFNYFGIPAAGGVGGLGGVGGVGGLPYMWPGMTGLMGDSAAMAAYPQFSQFSGMSMHTTNPAWPASSFGQFSAGLGPLPSNSAGTTSFPSSQAMQLQPHAAGEEVTTIMLRNIPLKYTRETLLHDLDNRGFALSYDFFYLPMDFERRCSVGYAFINFVNPSWVEKFKQAYQGLQLASDSAKVCEVGNAKVQGKHKNIQYYRNSTVMAMDEEYQPIIFENGVRAPFPKPTQQPKPFRPRGDRRGQ